MDVTRLHLKGVYGHFEFVLDKVALRRKERNSKIITDFNAWALSRDSGETNARSQSLLQAFPQMDIILAKENDVSTFWSSLSVDLPFVIPVLERDMSWTVLDYVYQEQSSTEKKDNKLNRPGAKRLLP